MAATPAQVRRLRRMTAEPTEAVYMDADMVSAIERHPLVDAFGFDPTADDWTATYDLPAAAADIWEEKAAALATAFDFQADGAAYQRSQKYEQALRQARRYRSSSAAVGVSFYTTFEEETVL